MKQAKTIFRDYLNPTRYDKQNTFSHQMDKLGQTFHRGEVVVAIRTGRRVEEVIISLTTRGPIIRCRGALP